jgi:valyl-tRNA synthetase
MNENAGIRYQGMKAAVAREQITKDLQELGLIEKIEDYEHNIARCDRCNSVIEPLPSKQWFLKMKELAQMALAAQKEGKVRFHPERWAGPFENWLNNIRDWNISRQLWWGHKIPLEGENDVLDTWFSSALWPFATLGWPDENSKDFREYYPTQYITSARDILYLWITRMIFSGLEFTDKAPFNDIYIHATVLTKDGKRMSKSLGTGVNPLGLVEKYGADAVRFGLAYQTTGLQDMRFNEDVISMGQKFGNKFWNIARFILLKIGDDEIELKPKEQLLKDLDTSDLDKQNVEFLASMDATAGTVTENLERFEFGDAAHTIYDFIWHELADKYIEFTKDKNDKLTKEILFHCLVECLKLLHPFMPFLTEEIYSRLPLNGKKMLIVENWPRSK